MRILYLSTWFPYPFDNGAKIRVYHLLRALGARHEVSLLSFAFDTAQPQHGLPGPVLQARRNNRPHPFQRKATRSALRFLSADPVVTLPLPDVTARVERLYAQTTFDVVIASVEVTAVYALQAHCSALKVLEEHNSLTRWMRERYEQQSSVLQRLRCWVSWQKTRAYEAKSFLSALICVRWCHSRISKRV